VNPEIAQMMSLEGKVAIVTGGAMGIGQGITLRLAQAGASVMIADVNDEAGNRTAEEIRSTGADVLFAQVDVSSVPDAYKAVEATVKAFGRLDILVNAAGVYPFTRVMEITEEVWDRVFDINTKGAFFFSKAAAEGMISEGHGGKIINIASVGALSPTGGLAHYDSSKSAVIMITKALALELGPHGITVNAVAPGSTITEGTGERLKGERGKFLSSKLPLGGLGEPDDIAKVVLFLVSAAADYMTGSLLVVDGGYLLI
jgi:2-deoxy-D-gluconate 3-dehydrogenase